MLYVDGTDNFIYVSFNGKPVETVMWNGTVVWQFVSYVQVSPADILLGYDVPLTLYVRILSSTGWRLS